MNIAPVIRRMPTASLLMLLVLLALNSSSGCRQLPSAEVNAANGRAPLPDPIPGPDAVPRTGQDDAPRRGDLDRRATPDHVIRGQDRGIASSSAANSSGRSGRPDEDPGVEHAHELAQLVVKVEAAKPDGGVVRIALFADSETYRSRESPIRVAEMQPSDSRCQWELIDLAPGAYAVAAYQDENGNGQLDMGTFGIPGEPYGFSNQDASRVRPPSFEAAKVVCEGGMTEIRVILRDF